MLRKCVYILVCALLLAPAMLQPVTPVAAGPAFQTVPAAPAPGTYQSTTRSAADAPGRVYTLTLGTDGSAIFSTDFLNDASPLEELGTWVQDDAGKVVITLTGTLARDYDQPVQIAFALNGKSLQTVPEDPNFGDEGLSLTLTHSAAPLAASEPENSPTGTYVSKPFADGDELALAVLHLAEDGSALALAIALAGEAPATLSGAWAADVAGAVAVTLTTRLAADLDGVTRTVALDDPAEVVLEPGADGELIGDGVVLYPAASLGKEAETAQPAGLSAPAGIAIGAVEFVSYRSEVLPSADSPGVQITMTFGEDGSFQASTDYLDGILAILEVGTWTRGEAGAITVNVTGTADEVYEQPAAFTVEEQEDGDLLAINPEIFGVEGLLLQRSPAE